MRLSLRLESTPRSLARAIGSGLHPLLRPFHRLPPSHPPTQQVHFRSVRLQTSRHRSWLAFVSVHPVWQLHLLRWLSFARRKERPCKDCLQCPAHSPPRKPLSAPVYPLVPQSLWPIQRKPSLVMAAKLMQAARTSRSSAMLMLKRNSISLTTKVRQLQTAERSTPSVRVGRTMSRGRGRPVLGQQGDLGTCHPVSQVGS
jgi:hypothetical protein